MAKAGRMKLNVAYPATGCQKMIEIEDELKIRPFYDKRISQELEVDFLGNEWAGYVLRITGGNDKEGFPMKQGVLVPGRVKLLLSKGHTCFHPRRKGHRKRKSVHGCIVDSTLSVLNVIVVKKGENEIPGLTDHTIPRRLGPKRVGKIRRLYNLSKEDDVRQYVIRRPLPVKEGKKQQFKAPKIQRLITPVKLQRKRHRISLRRRWAEKSRQEASDYKKLLAQRMKEAREKQQIAKRRLSSKRSSTSSA